MRHVNGRHGIQLNAIESIRGIAALMIVFYHFIKLVKFPLPDALAVISTGLDLGVPLFYTLSGFVLAYGYADQLIGRDAILSFYVRRLFRIMPLFYVMIALWTLVGWFLWDAVNSGRTLLFNVSFLFGLAPGEHESIVWAGWSIGVEMLYYLAFPLLSALLYNVRTSLAGLAVACFLSDYSYRTLGEAGFGSYAYMNVATHLPFFLAGVVCFRIWQRLDYVRHPSGWALLACSVGLAAMINASSIRAALMTVVSGHVLLIAWSAVFGTLVLASCIAENPLLERGPLRELGKLSFSLYLVHPILMAGMMQYDFSGRVSALVGTPDMAFLTGIVLTLALLWAISSVTFRYIETPGINLGRRISSRFRNRRLRTLV